MIDDDAQHHAHRLAPELHVEDLEPVAAGHAFRRLTDPRQFRPHRWTLPLKTKSGQRPTRVTLLEPATHKYSMRPAFAPIRRYGGQAFAVCETGVTSRS